MKHRKLAGILVSLSLALSLPMVTFAAPPADAAADAAPIVILHTNDVHCGIDDAIGYAGLAAYKAEMEAAYGADRVTLLDAGDAIQGGALGTLSDGAFVVDIMNQAGYDLAVPGNHEFDYGMENFLTLADSRADFPWLSCNFMDLTAGTPALDPYLIQDYGDIQIAYVGISTPESLTKTAPTCFQDENGNFIYGFCQGQDGAFLYAAVQSAVDSARAQGADYVVAVGHLGNEGITPEYSSEAVISHTDGIDVFIDGHSHETCERSVKNAAGENVLLAQTGTKLTAVGKVVIDPASGDVSSGLITDYTAKEPVMAVFLQALEAGFSDILGQVVADSEVDLTTMDPATGLRRIRNGETNLGDLVADAYRVVMGADIGMVNGGGIRADLEKGEITYEDIINVHPYGNEMCLVEATGQEILDALELGVMNYPAEDGGFQHVSGLTFTIDASVSSSVVLDESGAFAGVAGPYRVTDVLVNGQPLDLNAVYTVASHNYMIKEGGSGFSMFMDNTLLQDCTMLDNQLLIDYITDHLGGTIGNGYANPYGDGRIQVVGAAEAADAA